MQGAARYSTLDALRGIAALQVYLFHAWRSSPIFVPAGYLAVDLFFLLSGFVLANAYEQRLREGMSAGQFMIKRLIRLYPVYLIAALAFGGNAGQLLMIPDLRIGPAAFAPNVPMWTLLFELVASLIYALVLWRLGWKGLLAVLLASAAALVSGALLVRGSANFDRTWSDSFWLFSRLMFSFTAGVLLWRRYMAAGSPRRETRLGWLLPVPLFVALGALPPSGAARDLGCILLLFPGLVWLGARWDLADSRIAAALGDASYPFYCLHFPVMLIAFDAGIGPAALLALLLPAAWLIDRVYDRKVRAWLTALTSGRRRKSRAQTLGQTRIGINT